MCLPIQIEMSLIENIFKVEEHYLFTIWLVKSYENQVNMC